MSARKACAALVLLAASSCVGTTGSSLVSFPAYVAGPADANETKEYVFTSGRGWEVTLDLAVLHIGGIYLNRAVPVSGAQATSCVLPASYVAQVSGGLDVDVISPKLQPFPVTGEATQTRARAGEVWLTSGDVDQGDDATPIVRLHGFAARGGDRREIAGAITIGKNRATPVKDPSQPGASPICKQRIVSPILTDITPVDGGALLVRIDPKPWFANVDFSSLEAGSDGIYRFQDENEGQPNVSLFQGVRASSGVYDFSWVAPPDVTSSGGGSSFQHEDLTGGAAGGAGGSAGANQGLPCPVASTDVYAPAALPSFSPPADPGPGGILFDISGEVLAFSGYPFPPASPDDPAFVDGWDIELTRLLVTVDAITLSETPDRDPGDPSKTGAPVARADGPWAVDLHQRGALAGKGGGDETAIPIAALSGQNLAGGAAFDGAVRYAFGFDTVAATQTARNVNLDAAGLADYAEMIAKGYTVLYVGTATFKGTSCSPADAEFDRLPKVVSLRLGFSSPTTYVNCQNPDNDPATPFPDEEHERGISIKDNASVIGQVTIHTDHPFWDSVVHDSPAHFDQIAAQYTCVKSGEVPVARVEDLAGVDFLGFKDRDGNDLPWRTCVGNAFAAPAGTMHFDPQNLAVDPSNTDGSKLRDYRDYLVYDQSTQGHLNSDGLCFVRRNYPSPP